VVILLEVFLLLTLFEIVLLFPYKLLQFLFVWSLGVAYDFNKQVCLYLSQADLDAYLSYHLSRKGSVLLVPHLVELLLDLLAETLLVVFVGVLFGKQFVINLCGRQVLNRECVIPYFFLPKAYRIVFHLEWDLMHVTIKYIPQTPHVMLKILLL